MIRAFLAVRLPPEEHQAVIKVSAQIQQVQGASSVRWVHENGFHLTLAFLGNIREDRVDTVGETITDIIQKFENIPCKFSEKLIVFPSWQRMRVITIGIVDLNNKLHALQKQIAVALKSADFKVDDKKFQPHLTLGRVRKNTPQNRINELAKILISQSLDLHSSWLIDQVDLIQSQLGSGPPRYTILKSFPLGAN